MSVNNEREIEMCKSNDRALLAAHLFFSGKAITRVAAGKRTLTPSGRPKPLTKTQIAALASEQKEILEIADAA